MTSNEKHDRLALALGVVTKLGLTAKELHNYAQAQAIIKTAEANQTDPREDAAKLTHYSNKDQLLGALLGLEVAHMVEEIIQVEDLLI